MKQVKHFLLTTITTIFCFISLAQANEFAEAEAFMQDVLDELVDIVNDESHSPDEKRALSERLVKKHLALGHMALQSIGNEKENFTHEELVDFSNEFQQHLLHAYNTRIATYDGNGIEIAASKKDEETGQIIISTKGGVRGIFFQPGSNKPKKTNATYHLVNIKDEWKIVSIIFEGIDINANFRSQFQAVLTKKSPQEIIKELHLSNALKEATNPFSQE